MSNRDPSGPVLCPPVAARETRRARDRARRAARRRRVYSALVLAFSLLLLAGSGVAYRDHTRRQPIEFPQLPDSQSASSPGLSLMSR